MINNSEKVPRRLLERIKYTDSNEGYKETLNELFSYIAHSCIFNVKFLDNFNLFLGSSFNSKNLLFHLSINERDICIYDQDEMGDKCMLFFEFESRCKNLIYSFDRKNNHHSHITNCYDIKILRSGLEKISRDTDLFNKYNLKKLKTRQDRKNIKLLELMYRRYSV